MCCLDDKLHFLVCRLLPLSSVLEEFLAFSWIQEALCETKVNLCVLFTVVRREPHCAISDSGAMPTHTHSTQAGQHAETPTLRDRHGLRKRIAGRPSPLRTHRQQALAESQPSSHSG